MSAGGKGLEQTAVDLNMPILRNLHIQLAELAYGNDGSDLQVREVNKLTRKDGKWRQSVSAKNTLTTVPEELGGQTKADAILLLSRNQLTNQPVKYAVTDY